MPPIPLGKTGTRYARAMNKLGWHWWPSDTTIATTRLRGPRARASTSATARRAARRAPRPAPTSPTGRSRIRAGVELRTRCRVREITTNEHGMASGAIYYDADGARALPAGRGRDPGLQRRRHAAPAAELGLGAVSRRARQLLRPGRQEPDAASLADDLGLCRRGAGRRARRRITSMWSKQFYETDPSRGFVRGYTLQFDRGTGPANEAITSVATGRLPWGRDHHRVFREHVRPPASASASPARTCPRSTTGSRSIPC